MIPAKKKILSPKEILVVLLHLLLLLCKRPFLPPKLEVKAPIRNIEKNPLA